MRNILVLAALSAGTLVSAATLRSAAPPHATPSSAPARLTIDSQKVAGKEVVVHLANLSDVPASAYMVGASQAEFAGAEFVIIDSLLGARDGKTLGPGETAEARIPTARADAEVRVIAAIFEDGTTEGDGVSVRRLLRSRQDVYDELPQALALLRHAASQNMTSSAAAFWFHQWRERWLAGDAARTIPVPFAAEMFLKQMGSQPAEGPARELIQAFEELSAKLAKSKPSL